MSAKRSPSSSSPANNTAGHDDPVAVADQLNDDEFFVSYLQEFQDDLLNEQLAARFAKVLAARKDGFDQKYAVARGQIQTALSGWSLDEQRLHELRCLIEDDVARADHEAGKINQLSSVERRGNIVRALGLLGVVLGVALASYVYLAPKAQEKFAPLEYLVYEAELMTGDAERLFLPSQDIEEVREYILRYPNLGFKPLPVYALKSENWALEGATVIDYEFIRIPVVQYSSFSAPGDKLHLFQYHGKLIELPKSSAGEFKGFKYQAYSNNQVNIIAWQAHDAIVGMMIGTAGAQDLARFARAALHQPDDSNNH